MLLFKHLLDRLERSMSRRDSVPDRLKPPAQSPPCDGRDRAQASEGHRVPSRRRRGNRFTAPATRRAGGALLPAQVILAPALTNYTFRELHNALKTSRLQPRRGCTQQPRVSAAPPWVIGPSTHRTLKGFHSSRLIGSGLCNPFRVGIRLAGDPGWRGASRQLTLGYWVEPFQGSRAKRAKF